MPKLYIMPPPLMCFSKPRNAVIGGIGCSVTLPKGGDPHENHRQKDFRDREADLALRKKGETLTVSAERGRELIDKGFSAAAAQTPHAAFFASSTRSSKPSQTTSHGRKQRSCA